MGAKSTRSISRQIALDFINSYLDEVDDNTLALIVENVNDYLLETKENNHLGLSNFYIDDTGKTS